MMKIVFVNAILFLVSVSVFAQKESILPEGIEYTSFEIKKGNSQAVRLGDPAGSIVQNFGTPTSSEPYYYEIDEKMAKIIKY
ncbi:MAG: hypothetical protein WBA74_21720, partial [Cyclobacteriaceae bacterium]